MTTEPTPFLFEGEHLVRVIDQSGDPWFVAKDAAHLLGYRDAEKITRLLDDDEKGTLKMGTLGGEQEVSIISEPGLYKAIARSSKPQAKRVDRWIRHEVLPSIRRTGSYTAPKAKRKPADPDSEKIRAQKAYITQLNATTRAMREIRLTLGIREAAKAAPALVKPLGITIDPNNADCFRQGDLDFPPGGGNA